MSKPVISEEMKKRWLAEERHFSTLSKAFITRKTRVFGIPPYETELGYTLVNKGDIADIHVARLHEIMKTLSEKERSFFRLGVYAHEALHQIYTNFDETNRIIKSYKRVSERNIFAEVSNIVEDTRIEYFAHQAIGGEALSALQFTIRHIYLKSELGNETHPVSQALNALIQLGDMGIIRGKFTFPEAFEIFSRIVPLFEEAVKMPVCADALQVSKQICEIIFEYIDFEFEDYLDELFKAASKGKKSGKGSDAEAEDENEGEGDGDGSSPGTASKSKRSRAKETLDKLGIKEEPTEGSSSEGDEKTSADTGSISGASGEKDEGADKTSSGTSSEDEAGKEDGSESSDTLMPSRKDDIFSLDDFDSDFSEDSDKKGDSDKKSEDSTDEPSDESSDETTDAGETTSDITYGISEDELEEINEILQKKFEEMSEDKILDTDYSEEIENLASTIDSEIKAAESKEKAEASDSEKHSIPDMVTLNNDPFVNLLLNKKMPPQSVEVYESLVAKISPLISSTAKAVERIVKRDVEEKERHTSGEINLNRYHDVTYTSARVFDKRREPLTLGDTCITVFVDESGSMGGTKEIAAREGAILLAEVCSKLKIPCYIAGYSADEFTYEVDLRHYVTWKNTKADRTSLVSLQGRRENRDGASIRAITEVVKKRSEERKILFVISDGQPCANNYFGKAAILDTKNAIREARKKFDVVVGISLGSADINELHEMYGNDFVSVKNSSELPEQLSKLFKKMFK